MNHEVSKTAHAEMGTDQTHITGVALLSIHVTGRRTESHRPLRAPLRCHSCFPVLNHFRKGVGYNQPTKKQIKQINSRCQLDPKGKPQYIIFLLNHSITYKDLAT